MTEKDDMERKKADEIMSKFFEEHERESITQSEAYDCLVSSYTNPDKMSHWAFYEWINKQVELGNIRVEPIAKIVDYKLIYVKSKKTVKILMG